MIGAKPVIQCVDVREIEASMFNSLDKSPTDERENRAAYDCHRNNRLECSVERNSKESLEDTTPKRDPRDTEVAYQKGGEGRASNFKKDLLVTEARKINYSPIDKLRPSSIEAGIGSTQEVGTGQGPRDEKHSREFWKEFWKGSRDELEEFSQEFLDEINPLNGKLTVQREKAPLDDCVRKAIIDHSISKSVVRNIRDDSNVASSSLRALLATELTQRRTFEDQ